jgi:putative phosphoesterase
MRIAVIADVHGNLRALEAVQVDLAKRSPDLVVNLGDNVSGPLQAAATADLMMNQSYIQIRGNHDRQLVDRPPADMGPSDRAAYGQLNSRHLAWLANLPPAQTLAGGVLLCHGAPGNDLQYLLEEVDGDRVRLASPFEVRERLGEIGARLVLCGHSHIPRIVSLPGGMWIVNPGSVGLQAYCDEAPVHYVEAGSPHARYGVIDWREKVPKVDFITVEYDWEAASNEAAQANRPDWAYALATGYALRAS